MAFPLRHARLSPSGTASFGRIALPAAALALPPLAAAAVPAQAWTRLAAQPALLHSALLSLWTGLASTALALAATVAILALLHGRSAERWAGAPLVPLLAVPHAAFALGFAFLIAPSGWIVRLLSPEITGFQRPPDWPVPGDPFGLSLIGGLALRELPFLLLAALAAKARIGLVPLEASARTLGCRPVEAFLRVGLPRIRGRIRLPVLAVLVYGTANVDMAAVLAPDLPAPLALRTVRWFFDPDPAGMDLALAAVPLLAALVAVAILLWRPLEEGLFALLVRSGPTTPACGLVALAVLALFGAGSLCALVLWALAGPWPFPDALPAALGTRTLELAAVDLAGTLRTTLLLALAVAALAVAGARLLLRPGGAPAPLVPLPLLPLFAPPVVVAPLLHRAALALGAEGTVAAVAAGHLLYALPYALLVLEGPVRRVPPPLFAAARILGASPWRRFTELELPLLFPAFALAFATALSVSFAQYETTLFLGGGRIRTLATETVAYLAAGDRRLAACAGLLAALPPLLGFVPAALAVRRGLSRRAAARTGPRCPPR